MHGTNIRKPPTMLWWQRSSWLPCPSGKAGLDDDMIVASGRKGDKYAVFGIFFWFRRRRLSSRGRKLRHVTDGEAIPSKNSSLDISLARSSSAGTPSSSDNSPPRSSSSAGSQPSPLPLPLPEVQALLRRVANSGNSSPYSGKTPLPSPKKSHPHRDEEAHSLQRYIQKVSKILKFRLRLICSIDSHSCSYQPNFPVFLVRYISADFLTKLLEEQERIQ